MLTLGALLADVPHTRPTAVFGTSYDPVVVDALRLEPSRYEGPTGIVGVLHDACRTRGINSASLWATVPSYVASAPSPKAALALVERVGGMLGIERARSATSSRRRPTTSSRSPTWCPRTRTRSRTCGTSRSSRTARSVDVDNVADLVAEVERFLREQ